MADFTSQTWFQGFNEIGEQIFGKTANEMMELKEADEQAFKLAVSQTNFQSYVFKIKAKAENYQVKSRGLFFDDNFHFPEKKALFLR